jgi:MtrB/PioB family decaheme-associated outer membrane protein
MRRNNSFRFIVLTLAVLSLALVGVARADDSEKEEDGSIQQIVIGVQGTSVDAEQDRDGRFNRYSDTPNGFVMDYLRIARLFGDGKNFVDFRAFDAMQEDERYRARLGLGNKLRLRYAFNATPMVFGNRARTLLGGSLAGELRIADFIQQQLEDPDGNGIPFFSEPNGPGGDNALVQGFTRDLLSGAVPFDLSLKRRTTDFGLTYGPSSAWSVKYDYQRHASRGTQPLGSGSYQRITDVDGDGSTDYDYFFSIRGLELPAPIEFDTLNTSLAANYRQDRWFGQLKYTYSEFENDNPFLLYDNPFWFNGVDATSGSRRGLWEEGRASQPPSNDAWNLSLIGGFDLAKHTRLTASFSLGEHSQNDPFAPISTNPALAGTADLNGDGVINTSDDPRSLALLPQSSLNATSDITVYNFRLTSKPTDRVRLNASWRVYEYDGGSSNLVLPGRAEYIESHIKTDFKGTSLAFVPHYYERQNLKVEGIFDLSEDLRLAAFWKRDGYDWNRFETLDSGASRETGNRSVEGTDDDTVGVRLFWDGPTWVDARLDFSNSKREFDGTHRIGFSGQMEELRQFDIANRDRDAYDLRIDFYPKDGMTIGVELRDWDDDYPDSLYGFLNGSSTDWTLDASFSLADTTTLFLYLGGSEAETDMHLRTKCSNCTPPAGAPWSAPWGVPNYDWFPTYEDEGTSFGGALSYHSEDDLHQFDLEFDYYDASIEQRNSNPATPLDLGKADAPPVGVSLAFDFPDQTNTSTTVEARYQRKLSKRTTVGVLYVFEDWDLDDFQLQQLQAYGADFLTVDDATRFMFLDAWYGTFNAHVGQFFVKLNL